MSTEPPARTNDHDAARTAWEAAQAKADEGRRLISEAATESRQIVTALHRTGMTQKQIATLLSITQGRVSQLIDRTPHPR